MNKLPPVDQELEKLVRDSLKLENVPCSSDTTFLQTLQRRLDTVPPPLQRAPEETRVKPTPPWRPMWRTGVLNGITGVAVALILLLGLNVLPGFMVQVTVAGSSMAQEQLVSLTIRQQVAWNQILVTLENQTWVYLQR